MSRLPGQQNEIVIYVGTRKLMVLEGRVGAGQPCVLRAAKKIKPEGFENGFVNHLERATDTLRSLTDKFLPATESSEISAYVVLGNSKLKTFRFSSSQYFSGSQRTLATSDVRSVVNLAKSVATLPLTESVLQAIPESFWVNDMPDIRNPLGLEAHRLGVNLKMFTMNFQDFKNLSRAFETAEIDVKGYFPKTLTVSEAVLTEQEKNEGAMIVDVADETAYFMLWRNGFMIASRALPLGGRFLTARVASAWEIESHDAEKVKERYASLSPDPKFGEELIPLVERNGKGNHPIRRQEFQEKFFGQCKEWMEMLLKEADAFAREEKVFYPHYVFTGGGTSFDGFLEFLQSQFSRDARLGLTRMMEAPKELIMDPSAVPALGMYRWLALHDAEQKRLVEPRGFMEKAFASANDWFSNYF